MSGGGTLERVLVSTTRSGCEFPIVAGRGQTRRGGKKMLIVWDDRQTDRMGTEMGWLSLHFEGL